MPPKNKPVDPIVELYKDPKTGLQGLHGFAKANNIKLDDAKKALQGIEPYSLNKYTRANFPRRKVIVNHIDEIWSVDLMDCQKDEKENNGIRFLFICVDVMSKFVWVVPMKSKADTVEAFKEILAVSKRKPQKLWVDNGTEFYNKKFEKLMKDNHIEMYSTHTEKSVFAERFIRTLRLRFGRLADIRGNWRFIDALPEIIKLYNNTKHTTTKIAPSAVTEADESIIQQRMCNKAAPNTTPAFSVGDVVRIHMKKQTFGKEYDRERWSRQLYTVSNIALTHPVTYEIKGYDGEEIIGRFYEQDLQKVPKQKDQKYAVKVLERRTRKGVKEARVEWIGYDKPDAVRPVPKGPGVSHWIPASDIEDI